MYNIFIHLFTHYKKYLSTFSEKIIDTKMNSLRF